jgi:hypothetical protein
MPSLVGTPAATLEEIASEVTPGAAIPPYRSGFRQAVIEVGPGDIPAGVLSHVLFACIARNNDGGGFGGVGIACSVGGVNVPAITGVARSESTGGPLAINLFQVEAAGFTEATITASFSGFWLGGDGWLQVVPIGIVGIISSTESAIRTSLPVDTIVPTPGPDPWNVGEANNILVALQWSATEPDIDTANMFTAWHVEDTSSSVAGSIVVKTARFDPVDPGDYDLMTWDTDLLSPANVWAAMTIEIGEYIEPPGPTRRIRRGLGLVRG